MRRQPVSGGARRRPFRDRRFEFISKVKTMPPPVGGWNRRDALSNMAPTDAVRLHNWFPRQSDVVTRPGFAEHCDTSDASTIAQLIPHEYQADTKLVAAVNGKLIDVTTGTPSSLATGLNGNYWSYDYLSGVTLLANGQDVVKSYDGTTIANPAYTGVTLSLLENVSVYKSRAYFTEKNSQSMWYGDTGAIAGALVEFNFGLVSGIEGNLCFTSHLKGDGGDGGADDVFVAVFKGGDVLAYSGSDPGDPTDWSLVGHYKIGRPLSRLAHLRADDDIYVITDRGYEQLSQMVRFGESYQQRELLSYKIQLEVSERIKEIGDNDDWRVAIYPKEQMLMLTVPRTGTARVNHVQNINTRAWCEFDVQSYSWALLDGNMYFGGSDGKIYQFGNDVITDSGTSIRADCQQAWTHFGSPGIIKQMDLIKPFLYSRAQPSISINHGSDYETIALDSFTAASQINDSIWDQAIWDQAVWANKEQTFANWFSRNAVGEAIGLRLAVETGTFPVRWNQTTLTFKTGTFL